MHNKEDDYYKQTIVCLLGFFAPLRGAIDGSGLACDGGILTSTSDPLTRHFLLLIRPCEVLSRIANTTILEVAQPRHRDDLHDLGALPVQPHDLLAAFVKLLQRLISCAFFFHHFLIKKIRQSSDFIGPYL